MLFIDTHKLTDNKKAAKIILAAFLLLIHSAN
jgi:hypothetical protein